MHSLMLMSVLIATPLVAEAEEGGDLLALQGTWKIASVTIYGGEVPLDSREAESRMTIVGATLTFLKVGQKPEKTSFRIDSTKAGKTIDFGTEQGIYELKDNQLTICISERQVLLVFRREHR